MRTRLIEFCEEFDEVVRGLLKPIQRSTEALGGARLRPSMEGVRAGLLDLRHQLEVLADKVAEQQAYVLIFGPLKSGKSTLMNALSSAYVSEVTSLPAYPCLVYVSHSPERRFTIYRYDGRTEEYADAASLHAHVERSHGELAERIRRVEETGGSFDPALHFPEAIRRIDFKLPAPELGESGAVLVDTPGLYSRMKFGYDRMTREFRNVAACAIFVVKSDNLFLDQVFEEFTQLLDLFSRIFLVVNLDTHKRDLRPGGDLVPSIERQDPQRIIAAFESLSMSAPLKSAAAEGRLRIYPVDLLQAASLRLRTSPPGAPQSEPSFDRFLDDLTAYLNSTEYLVAFLGDSLRRAKSLVGEGVEWCRHPSATSLRNRAREIQSEQDMLERRRDATQRLSQHDWKNVFGELRSRLSSAVKDRQAQVETSAATTLDRALANWFTTDSSLQTLVEQDLAPVFTDFQKSLCDYVGGALDERVSSGTAGVQVPLEVATALGAAGVDIGSLGRESLKEINRAQLVEKPRPSLRSEDITLRKTFWDWLLFRSQSTLRNRVFGPPENPTIRIAPQDKERRLGEVAREQLRNRLSDYQNALSAKTVRQLEERLLGEYAGGMVRRLGTLMKENRERLSNQLADLDVQAREIEQILAALDELQQETKEVEQKVADLWERYGKTDPDLLLREAPPREVAAKPTAAAPAAAAPPASKAAPPRAAEPSAKPEARAFKVPDSPPR